MPPCAAANLSVYARWGGNVAILSGDAMLISAYRLLAQAPPALLPRILEVFNTMALGVCEGQQYDMDFESKQKVSVVEYMSMIELKTSVLVAGSAMMGAILGGADEEQSRRLYQFAIELGMAFQLQDDLLDSYGGEELGKTIGGDILEGKKSYLMVTAMSRADEERARCRATPARMRRLPLRRRSPVCAPSSTRWMCRVSRSSRFRCVSTVRWRRSTD